MKRLTIALLLLAACATATVRRESSRVDAVISGNRVHIPVAINGGEPATFILDTGAASMTLEEDHAASRGIKATSRGQARGASGSIDIGFAPDVEFAYGGRSVRPKRSPLLPLRPIMLRSGTPVQGVIGYDVFAPNVVEIDYEGGAVTFHDPRAFQPPAGAARVAMEIPHRIPVVTVRLTLPDGRTLPARLLLDTGAANSLMLTRGFTDRNNVEVEGGRETSIGLGIGGATRERTGRLAKLEFGGFTFDKPIAGLSRSTAGALSDNTIDGILGGEILRRFTLYLDYGRKQLHLAPNRAFDDPLETDMTGVLLEARDTTYRDIVVHTVTEDSPAAEADVRVGDQLRAIDGRPVVATQLHDIRKLFREPGKRYELTFVRDGAERVVTIVTRRMT